MKMSFLGITLDDSPKELEFIQICIQVRPMQTCRCLSFKYQYLVAKEKPPVGPVLVTDMCAAKIMPKQVESNRDGVKITSQNYNCNLFLQEKWYAS